MVYVKNLCHALMCADEALRTRPGTCGGRPYFVTDDPSLTRGGFHRMLLSCRGDGVTGTGTVPSWVVRCAAYPAALLDLATGGRLRHNTMQVLTTTTVFTATIDLPVDACAARRDLGCGREPPTRRC